jgi:hypothetical protein
MNPFLRNDEVVWSPPDILRRKTNENRVRKAAKVSSHPTPFILWSKRDLKNISEEYAALFARFQKVGWDGYVFTVEFGALRGTETAGDGNGAGDIQTIWSNFKKLGGNEMGET